MADAQSSGKLSVPSDFPSLSLVKGISNTAKGVTNEGQQNPKPRATPPAPSQGHPLSPDLAAVSDMRETLLLLHLESHTGC